MKLKNLLTKTLLAAGMLCFGGGNSWADEVVPTPVYFNDFSFAVSGSDGVEIVGNGKFENDDDPSFGRIFHNDPTLSKEKRKNYLKLPADILSHSGTTKELTIGFWVNMKSAEDFWFAPLFSAYGAAPSGDPLKNIWPVFICQSRGLLQVNCAGYNNFTAEDNVKSTNAENTLWLDDKKWHYYTVTLTESSAKVYIDGTIFNEWTISGEAEHTVSGLFSNGGDLNYICLGGNQAWDWDDLDPAFAFDDFAVYNKALTKAQIDQIRNNKLNRSVTGTQIGAKDNSTDYLGATSSQITLNPGESYHYRFINYNNGGYYTDYSVGRINSWNNWTLPVYNTSGDRVITLRADNWEDLHHVGDAWGSNLGCTSNFNWTDFSGNLNGATVDMTVSFTKDKVFTMSSTINTVDGSTWNYSYTNDYTDSPISLTSNDYIKVALSVSRSWIDLVNEGYSAVTATITADYGTFSSPYALNFTPGNGVTGVVAYYASAATDGKVTMTKVTGTVPANTGLFLAKDGTGNAISIPVVASSTTELTNLLMPGTGAEVAAGNYVFAKQDDDYGFYRLGSATVVPAGKAYLKAGSYSARMSIAFDDDETTGINNVNVNHNDDWYDLQGRRVAQPQKGLYIVNGKKVVIK